MIKTECLMFIKRNVVLLIRVWQKILCYCGYICWSLSYEWVVNLIRCVKKFTTSMMYVAISAVSNSLSETVSFIANCSLKAIFQQKGNRQRLNVIKKEFCNFCDSNNKFPQVPKLLFILFHYMKNSLDKKLEIRRYYEKFRPCIDFWNFKRTANWIEFLVLMYERFHWFWSNDFRFLSFYFY